MGQKYQWEIWYNENQRTSACWNICWRSLVLVIAAPKGSNDFPKKKAFRVLVYCSERGILFQDTDHFYFTTKLYITIHPCLKLKEPSSYLRSFSTISSCLLCIFLPFLMLIFYILSRVFPRGWPSIITLHHSPVISHGPRSSFLDFEL